MRLQSGMTEGRFHHRQLDRCCARRSPS
jgi:hypothetical protein